MFMGEYNHTLDTKGRLIIPSKFRETLGEKFVVTKGLTAAYLCTTMPAGLLSKKSFRQCPSAEKDTRMFVRHFLAGAAEVEVDKQDVP